MAVGGNVSVGSLGSGVGVADGTCVRVGVAVGVGVLTSGLRASIDIPIQ